MTIKRFDEVEVYNGSGSDSYEFYYELSALVEGGYSINVNRPDGSQSASAGFSYFKPIDENDGECKVVFNSLNATASSSSQSFQTLSSTVEDYENRPSFEYNIVDSSIVSDFVLETNVKIPGRKLTVGESYRLDFELFSVSKKQKNNVELVISVPAGMEFVPDSINLKNMSFTHKTYSSPHNESGELVRKDDYVVLSIPFLGARDRIKGSFKLMAKEGAKKKEVFGHNFSVKSDNDEEALYFSNYDFSTGMTEVTLKSKTFVYLLDFLERAGEGDYGLPKGKNLLKMVEMLSETLDKKEIKKHLKLSNKISNFLEMRGVEASVSILAGMYVEARMNNHVFVASDYSEMSDLLILALMEELKARFPSDGFITQGIDYTAQGKSQIEEHLKRAIGQTPVSSDPDYVKRLEAGTHSVNYFTNGEDYNFRREQAAHEIAESVDALVEAGEIFARNHQSDRLTVNGQPLDDQNAALLTSAVIFDEAYRRSNTDNLLEGSFNDFGVANLSRIANDPLFNWFPGVRQVEMSVGPAQIKIRSNRPAIQDTLNQLGINLDLNQNNAWFEVAKLVRTDKRFTALLVLNILNRVRRNRDLATGLFGFHGINRSNYTARMLEILNNMVKLEVIFSVC